MSVSGSLGKTAFEALSPTQAIDPSWVKSGHVEEAGELLHASADGKYVVQLWECRTAVELEIPYYPVDEFITIIEGNVLITADKNITTEYVAGDSFVIPKGFAGSWRQEGRLRKYAACYLG